MIRFNLTVHKFGLLLIVALTSWANTASADMLRGGSIERGQPEILPVDEAFRFGFVPEDDGVKVFWQVMPGYYLYRDKFRFSAADSETALELSLPEGEVHDDETFGVVQVFEGLVEVDIPLTGQQTLDVRYQGCAEKGFCYPPQKRQIEFTQP